MAGSERLDSSSDATRGIGDDALPRHRLRNSHPGEEEGCDMSGWISIIQAGLLLTSASLTRTTLPEYAFTRSGAGELKQSDNEPQPMNQGVRSLFVCGLTMCFFNHRYRPTEVTQQWNLKSSPTTSNKDDSEVKSSRLAQRAAYPVFLSLGRAKPSRSLPHGTRIHTLDEIQGNSGGEGGRVGGSRLVSNANAPCHSVCSLAYRPGVYGGGIV
ncbi:hypothetical protein NQZ68_016140 [Dissostichus eleginoides]|nr:hypothetical protein NQZ68_016140 [Dissostichus eleginoides]